MEALNSVINALLYSILIVAAFLGNFLVLLVIVRNRFMHTTTNFLLANLAVAGLWTAIWSIPFVVATLLPHHLGKVADFMCKFISMNKLSGVSILVSASTMAILALERYYALLKPMDTQMRLTKGDVKRVVAGLWLFSILLNTPTIIYAEYDGQQCVYVLDKKAYGLLVILFTMLATCIITFCYFRIIKELYFSKTVCREDVDPLNGLKSKRRIVKLLLIQVTGFFVCYIPFVIVEFVIPRKMPKLLYICTYLLYCSAAVNPIIYAFRSSNYRKAYREIVLHLKEWICVCCFKKKEHQDHPPSTDKCKVKRFEITYC